MPSVGRLPLDPYEWPVLEPTPNGMHLSNPNAQLLFLECDIFPPIHNHQGFEKDHLLGHAALQSKFAHFRASTNYFSPCSC
jgi:hypothetical protein